MLNSDELHELYEGLKLNKVNRYDYVLTGKKSSFPGVPRRGKQGSRNMALLVANQAITMSPGYYSLNWLLLFNLEQPEFSSWEVVTG